MRYINLHTHSQTGNADIVELVNQYPDAFDPSAKWFSVGIHPWRIDENRLQQDIEVIEAKLSAKNCLAIGECGLDKRIGTSLDIQQEVFEIQLRLAQIHKKPVIIHCVAAFQEVITITKRMKISVPMVIHGYSKGEQLAGQLVEAGFYLSFGKWLLRNPELKSSFLSVPDNNFLLETDTAEETIQQVYERAAAYRELNVDAIGKLVRENFERIFGNRE